MPQKAREFLCSLVHAIPFFLPFCHYKLQHLPEGRHTHARCARVVSATYEGASVRSEPHAHRPTTPAGHPHHGLHVDVIQVRMLPVSYTHLRAHETKANLVCRLLLEKKKKK